MRNPVRILTVTVALVAATISGTPAGAAPLPRAAVSAPVAPMGVVAYHERVTAQRQAGASSALPAQLWCELWATFPTIVGIGQKWGPYTPTIAESVGGAAWVQCNVVMTEISVVTLMRWDGMDEPPGIPVQRPGVGSATSYNISVCSSGDWQIGDAMVVWPAGYGPPSPMAGFGPPIYLSPMDCV